MIGRIAIAIAVGVIAALLILLLGIICVALNVPVLESIGKFLEQWCWVFGAAIGVLSFFTGYNPFNRA